MIKCISGLAAIALAAALAVGYLAAQETVSKGADEEGIRQQSREFAKAFESGNAKAVASFWTEQGEYFDDTGLALRGRAEIEKEFAQFFKEHPKSQVAVEIESIRFPARDLAIEEGVLLQRAEGKALPASTRYSVIHVRENGQWRIAVCREWGAGQDRLHDLAWLLGEWKGGTKDQETLLSFEKDKKSSSIFARHTKKLKGEVVASGAIKISLDPHTGQLRSWHFDDDGGHGQSLWIRDGNRWVLDAVGALADGTDTAGVNVLTRINNDSFTWRSIDRVAGGEALPDTVPVKLARVASTK
jgi:uncharacterized protein (TIGR02246 family)